MTGPSCSLKQRTWRKHSAVEATRGRCNPSLRRRWQRRRVRIRSPEKRLRIEAKGMKLAAKRLAIRLTFQQDRDHRSTMDAHSHPTTYCDLAHIAYYFSGTHANAAAKQYACNCLTGPLGPGSHKHRTVLGTDNSRVWPSRGRNARGSNRPRMSTRADCRNRSST